MNNKLTLKLDGSTLDFSVRRVAVAGYTGRNASQVQAHITELQHHGIRPPQSVPTLYWVDPSWITVDADIVVGKRKVSGEAEPALLFYGNDLTNALISIGVDFTDREEERRSIPLSKELPKPLSRRVWRYGDMAPVWDEIVLRSWVEPGGRSQFYQLGKLSQLLAPEDLLACFKTELGDRLEGTVLLMGTLPLRSQAFSFAEYFACELKAPDRLALTCRCKIRRSNSPF